VATRRRGDEPDPLDLMQPFPSEPILWPISTRVNKSENDEPSILKPIKLGVLLLNVYQLLRRGEAIVGIFAECRTEARSPVPSLLRIFAALHESAIGTKRTLRDLVPMSALGVKRTSVGSY
jgi:hypothetical protein